MSVETILRACIPLSDRIACVAVLFLFPCHMGSHIPSSEDLFPCLRVAVCYAKSLFVAEDSPHTTMQYIIFQYNIGVLAGVCVL